MQWLSKRREYLAECNKHSKASGIVKLALFALGAYGLATNYAPLIDTPPGFLLDLPKIPLAWVVVAVLTGLAIIFFEGGYRFRQHELKEHAKDIQSLKAEREALNTEISSIKNSNLIIELEKLGEGFTRFDDRSLSIDIWLWSDGAERWAINATQETRKRFELLAEHGGKLLMSATMSASMRQETMSEADPLKRWLKALYYDMDAQSPDKTAVATGVESNEGRVAYMYVIDTPARHSDRLCHKLRSAETLRGL